MDSCVKDYEQANKKRIFENQYICCVILVISVI